jgi:uncharacterized protein YjiS (DUF1127 family)
MADMARMQPQLALAPPMDRGRAVSPATRVGAVARRAWRFYWERRAQRATVLILSSLDERTLRDIGLARSEIESCVYGGDNDRLRRYHATWPWRSSRR